jgi:lipopolysaccharide exporter
VAEALAPESDAAAANPAPQNATVSESTLRQFARANSWSAASRVVVALGNLIRFAIFARMLRPVDFGIVAAAFFCLDLLSVPTELNLMRALVQQEDDFDDYLHTVWVLDVVRSLAIAAILILLAKPLAMFFREGGSYKVFWGVAILGIVREMPSPALVKMFREMEYHNLLVLNIGEFVATLGFGIIAILVLRDWRAILAAVVCGQLVYTIISYTLYPYRPKLRFDFHKARQLFRFSRWITAARLAQFLAKQLDNVAVGHLLGPRLLGNYQMAFNIGEVPIAEFSGGVGQVVFPMVARLRDKKHDRDRVLYLAAAGITIAGVAYALFLMAWGGPLVLRIFGPKWTGVAGPLRFLCLYGLFQGLITLGFNFLEGAGKPSVSFKLCLIRLAALAVLIYPMTIRFGNSGAACAGLISVMVPIPFMIAFMREARE